IAETGGLDRVEETLDASINALLSRSIADRLSEIDRLLPLANSDEQDDLIREKSRLAEEIKALGRQRRKSFPSPRSRSFRSRSEGSCTQTLLRCWPCKTRTWLSTSWRRGSLS